VFANRAYGPKFTLFAEMTTAVRYLDNTFLCPLAIWIDNWVATFRDVEFNRLKRSLGNTHPSVCGIHLESTTPLYPTRQ